MAAIYHNSEESIRKWKRELTVHFVGGNFGKLSEEKSIFRSNFSSIWKERSSPFFDLY